MITISEVYRRYGVTLLTKESYELEWRAVDSLGPRDAGIIWPDTVIASSDAGVEDLLHELTHLVTASMRSDIDANPENDGQLQLEWAIARFMSKNDRKEIFDYALQTQVQIFDREYEDRLWALRGRRYYALDGEHVGAWLSTSRAASLRSTLRRFRRLSRSASSSH